MSHNTEIQWTHIPGYRGETWNPWTGCTKVSPGCAHCYIEDTPPFRKAGIRFVNGKIPITVYPDRFALPLQWRKPRAVFVNSMSDLFHEDVPEKTLAKVFAVMAVAGRMHGHIFMVLTKRPERMQALLSGDLRRPDPQRLDGLTFEARVLREIEAYEPPRHVRHAWQRAAYSGSFHATEWPSPHVWLGVTIENRRMVHRADLLRQTPAAVRFISAEPLLGPLVYDGIWKGRAVGSSTLPARRCWADGYDGPELDLSGIDWVITGGESGAQHRRFDPQWAIDLAAACYGPLDLRGAPPGRRRHVAFFHKQHGGRTPKAGGRLLDGRTYDEFPAIARG